MTDVTRERYSLAFRQTASPALITDEYFEIVDVNDAGVAFTGYDREELCGETPGMLVADPLVFEEIMETLLDGEAWRGDLEIRTKSGELVFGRASASPMVVDGEAIGYVGVFVDVTEQRRYEETLRVFNRVLRHNLRNDANVVAGALETVGTILERSAVVEGLAAEDPAAAKGLERALEMAHGRVESMLERGETTRRIGDLLSRHGADGLTTVRLDEELDAALDAVDLDDADLDVDRSGADVEVYADDLLREAIAALLENAVEHNDSETPAVDVAAEKRDGRVVLSIADDGPGIPPGTEDRIFGRTEGSQLFHSPGLDLFFVDRLLQFYGGEATVEDNDPRGAVFSLHLRPAG